MTNPPAFSDAGEPALGLKLVEQPDDQDGLDPDDDPAAGGAPGFDPEAPFGRFANGKPRKSPAGSRAAKPSGRRRTPSAPRKTGGGKKTPASARRDYVGASLGAVQLMQAGCGMIGAATKDPGWQATAATLVVMEGQLAEVSGSIADENQAWARALDRMVTTSTWTPALMAGVALIAQVAVNFNMLPAGLVGTRSREEVMAQAGEILAEREAMAQQMAAQRMAAAA